MIGYRQIQSRPTPEIWETVETVKAFAAIYFEDNTVLTTGIGATGIPIVTPVGGYSLGPSRGNPGIPPTTGIPIVIPGVYWVTFDASITNGTAGVTFDFYVHANGVEVPPGSHIRVQSLADSRAVALSFLASFAAGVMLVPTVHAETGINRSVLVEDCSLTAVCLS